MHHQGRLAPPLCPDPSTQGVIMSTHLVQEGLDLPAEAITQGQAIISARGPLIKFLSC